MCSSLTENKPARAPRKRLENPKVMAVQYRMWVMAEAAGWDLTLAEAAERLNVSVRLVIMAAHHKGWLDRFRVTKPTTYLRGGNLPGQLTRREEGIELTYKLRGAGPDADGDS